MCETMSLTMEEHVDKESPNLSKSMKRSNKPLMEKRRRERINVSLNALKALVLDALKKDTSQYSKLEKADILEMTVRHLRGVQRQQLAAAAATDSTVVHKYRAGFTECASEVSRYLSSVDGLDENVRGHMMMHLSQCVQRMNGMPATNLHQMPAQHQPAPQQMVPAAQPIRIQIPAATQVSSLPGAPVHLRAAPQQQQQQQLQALQQAQYFGALQVIPASSLVNVQTVNGTPVMGNVTPLYLSTPSISPQSTMSSPSSTCSSPERQLPTPPTTPQPCHPREPTPEKVVPAPSYAKASAHVYARPVNNYNAKAVEVMNAHNAIKDTLREEKVWRPW